MLQPRLPRLCESAVQRMKREEPVAGCGLETSKVKVGFKEVEVGGSYPMH